MNKFLAFGIAVVAAKAGGKEAPKAAASSAKGLLTVGGTYDFLVDSLKLSYDVGYFIGESSVGFVWGNVPQEARTAVVQQYQSVTHKAETLRIQNNIPSPSQAKNAVSNWVGNEFVPIVKSGVNVVRGALSVPQVYVEKGTKAFRSRYPASAAKLPTDIFDLLFTLFVVFYVFLYKLVWCTFKYLICCRCCRRRAGASKPVPVGKVSNKKKRN